MEEKLKSEIESRVSNLIEQDEFSPTEDFAVMEGNASLSLLPPKNYVHELDLEGLRPFPYYLCKSQLYTGYNIGDNRHYWGWTLVCATSMSAVELEIEGLRGAAVSDIASLLQLLHLGGVKSILRTVGEQKQRESSPPRIPIELTFEGMIPGDHDLDKQISRAAFSTLEAVLKQRCKEIDLEGRPINDPEYESYLEDYINSFGGNRAGYEDLLNLWTDRNSCEQTSECLTQIRDIDDNHATQNKSIVENMINRFDGSDSEDLFWLLRQLRNTNIHGEIEDFTESTDSNI